MKAIIIIVSLMIGPGLLTAEKYDRNIRGRVIDGITKIPLYGVNISIKGLESPLGTITNEAGEFLLWNIPKAETILAVSLIGYDTVCIDMAKPEVTDSTFVNFTNRNHLLIKLHPSSDLRKTAATSKKSRN